MVSNSTSTAPAVNSDGTLSALIQALQPLPGGGAIMRLWLPLSIQTGSYFGRFFLARCAEDTISARRSDWSVYARRALICAGAPTPTLEEAGSLWEFYVPISQDAGYQWLLNRPLNSSINLLGPFGQEFEGAQQSRAQLLLADLHTFPIVLPLIAPTLDRGGRVVLLIKGEVASAEPFLTWIPIPVELRIIPPDRWEQQLGEPLRWADQLCAALPFDDYAQLTHVVRSKRFSLDNSFAHVFVQSDLICGIGACLACVVPTRDGSHTRACIHGPVFPLTTLFA